MQGDQLAEYQRLRSEGRWSEANEFREVERRRLRVAGRTKQEAKDESWTAMVAKFPPLGQVASPSTDLDSERIEEVEGDYILEHNEDEIRELAELAQDPGAWKDSWTDAWRWANAFKKYDVPPSRAPSILAWLLRKLCREDFRRFAALVLMDHCRRHGYGLRFQPAESDREARMRAQIFEDLKADENLARWIEEARRLEESPTTAASR